MSLRCIALLALVDAAAALQLQVHAAGSQRRAHVCMSEQQLPSRRSVVSGAGLALLFGADAALAKAAPAAAPAATAATSGEIDWAAYGLSREVLGLPAEKKPEPEPAKQGKKPVPAANAAAPPAAKQTEPAKKVEAAPKAAAEPAKKAPAAPAKKDGKAKDPNALDLESLGLTKEALGLEEPKKKGAAKPPRPGEKPKPKPKPLTKKQQQEKKKKEKARAIKAKESKKKADKKAAERKVKEKAKAAEEKKKAEVKKKAERAAAEELKQWKAFKDDRNGKTYYYNSKTKASTYDAPPGFK